MKTGMYVLLCLLALARPASSQDATLFRVFLKDGTTLVSYGEFARVEDRVVFSMPVSLPGPATVVSLPPSAPALTPLTSSPPRVLELQLVNIASDRVDWTRTDAYAESARADHYIATRAMNDFAQLSNEVAESLNEIGRAPDARARLVIVERARKRLAEWPAAHYNFNVGEVQQLLVFLDEAIADLRASTGTARFDLNLVATAPVSQTFERLLPAPTLKESIEQVLLAASLADTPHERVALLSTALAGIERDFGEFPSDWAASTAASLRKGIEAEVRTDRAYTLLTESSMAEAARRARTADVLGLERLLNQIHERDLALGGTRPDAVKGLIESVKVQLTAAQTLQLARDHWADRLPAWRRYRTALRTTFEQFDLLKGPLDNIRALAGSNATGLASIERLTGQILRSLSQIKVPEELQPAHALLTSAAQLGGNAAALRRDAVRSGNMDRAWDASSAASGSLMLSARAREDIQKLLRMPELPQ